MNEDIKKCPCCGNNADYAFGSFIFSAQYCATLFIECIECKMRSDEFACFRLKDVDICKANALEVWNKRA